MTEERLKEIEDHMGEWDHVTVPDGHELIAEVRRLRALVKECEVEESESGNCPFCYAYRSKNSYSPIEPHKSNCPAFLPDGTVR